MTGGNGLRGGPAGHTPPGKGSPAVPRPPTAGPHCAFPAGFAPRGSGSASRAGVTAALPGRRFRSVMAALPVWAGHAPEARAGEAAGSAGIPRNLPGPPATPGAPWQPWRGRSR